jgi:hypothetical protein
MQTGRYLSIFPRILLSPSSEEKNTTFDVGEVSVGAERPIGAV